MKNSNLHNAKNAKNDEFFTCLEDIEKEMANYVPFFEGKTVYCNCDDYRWSNFTKCFKDNFEYLHLKKMICTNFDNGDGALKYEYDGENETITELEGNGSFDSEECVEILKEADVVVTNPPFSKVRLFFKTLVDNGYLDMKHFLFLGNNNMITFKEIFPYIKDNKLWLGYSANKTMKFQLSDSYEKWDEMDKNGKKYGKVPAITWFTNIPTYVKNDDLWKKN